MSSDRNAAANPSTADGRKIAVIIGAGPAGLTAALELLRRSDIRPVVLEATDAIGGISRTVEYKGNRMDIGGHRFFSKSDRVMQWWLEQMPAEAGADADAVICYRNQSRTLSAVAGAVPGTGADADADLVMLVRERRSRIYFLRQFFEYPVALTLDTLRKLGARRTVMIAGSYLKARLRPIQDERSLQDFLINRFGRELYLTFFKSYTEKVWRMPCEEISAEWGAQRIKGLSLRSAVKHFVAKRMGAHECDLAQKCTETSLVERFLYPKFGPGQLWEHVAKQVVEGGGAIHMEAAVDRLVVDGDRVVGVETIDESGARQSFAADYVFSTMPVRDLVRAMSEPAPANVYEVSEGLVYRDFIAVGMLVSRLEMEEAGGGRLRDTWIYIQEPDVQIGRLQIFNNWSPYMVADPDTVWIGLEYFCYETDPLWKMPDEDLKCFAAKELETIGVVRIADVLDAHVVRMPKTYPAYFGTYDRFDEIRNYTDRFENLFLVGRNGMHRYNNQDHSMLTAMTAVDQIVAGIRNPAELWEINTEQEYHETR